MSLYEGLICPLSQTEHLRKVRATLSESAVTKFRRGGCLKSKQTLRTIIVDEIVIRVLESFE